MAAFNRGDYVRKKYGTRVAEVQTCNDSGNLQIKYLHNGKAAYYEHARDYVKVNKEDYNEKGELIAMAANGNKLYEITSEGETTRIATKLMEKSPTQWIMEVKGTNEVLVVSSSQCKEIIPFTIKVVYTSGTIAVYHAEPDQYKKGDVYLVTTSGKPELAQVVELDCKQPSGKEFKHSGKIVLEKQ